MLNKESLRRKEHLCLDTQLVPFCVRNRAKWLLLFYAELRKMALVAVSAAVNLRSRRTSIHFSASAMIYAGRF